MKAKREFAHAQEARSLKLNTSRKMLIGFYEMTGPGAFSDIVTVALDDGNLANSVS